MKDSKISGRCIKQEEITGDILDWNSEGKRQLGRYRSR